ncbi:MAG TPA: VanW family protein [Roseiflexaceae bacterium]|nr:VanW family protein [Roseiflexaceae bacterium]
MKPSAALVYVAVLAALIWPAGLVQAQPAPTGSFIHIGSTGHNIGGAFRTYYEAHGSAATFGLPLTEIFADHGVRSQYFEYARFDMRSSGLTLARVGAEVTLGRNEPEFGWIDRDPGDGRTYFAASGHTLGGLFALFWEQNGGIQRFGYPISEELFEADGSGFSRRVQYFERARLELYPVGDSFQVRMGQLGRELLERRTDAAVLMTAAAPLTLLGTATTTFRTSAAERRHNIERAAAMFDGVVVAPGAEFSFLALGDFSEEAGFIEGYGIVGGRLERVIGGGLCQVSTTIFRAVSNAGLQITRRIPHTYIVFYYENIVGFDATVFSPSVDFRWRNDTAAPVYLAARTEPGGSTVTFEVWGVSDGRRVSYDGPHVRNVVQPGAAYWQFDPNLAPGATRQLVHGRPGMDVSYIRTVTLPDGTLLHRNNYQTRYRPWDDFFTYGAGVKPPAGSRIVAAPGSRP